MKKINLIAVHQFEIIKTKTGDFGHIFIMIRRSGKITIYDRMMQQWPYCVAFISGDFDQILLEALFYANQHPVKPDEDIIGMFSAVNVLSDQILVSQEQNEILFLGSKTVELLSVENPGHVKITLEDANEVLEHSLVFHQNMKPIYTTSENIKVVDSLREIIAEGGGPKLSVS